MEDTLSAALEAGLTLDEIQRMQRDGLDMDEILNAAQNLLQRGEPLIDPPGSDWEDLIPFDSTDNTPDFPVEKLPPAVCAFVEELAESTQTPEEMAGILSLGILATAFQSRYEAEVTQDWMEPLCLYTVAIAPPGERKSAVISALTRPLYEYEAEKRGLEAVEIAQNQEEKRLLEKSLQATENAVGKKGDIEAQRQKVLDLSAQLAEFKELYPTRLLLDDVTVEKLTDEMAKQNGSITIASAEGSLFDNIGRYDKTGNFDIFLKAHAGDPVCVSRIGRAENCIPKPRLSVMLAVQPDVIRGLMGNSAFKGRGLCGRFLYAVCRSKVGQRKVSPPPMSDSTKREYRQFVRRILADQGSGVVRLSTDANEIRERYQAYIEKKLGGEWEHMRDWGGKLVGAAVRIAALLHLSSFPVDVPISAETMAAATAMAEFLGGHAEAAYLTLGADADVEDARYILSRMRSLQKDVVTRTELTRLCRGHTVKRTRCGPVLMCCKSETIFVKLKLISATMGGSRRLI